MSTMTNALENVETEEPPSPGTRPQATKSPAPIAQESAANRKGSSISNDPQENGALGVAPNGDSGNTETVEHSEPSSSPIASTAAPKAEARSEEQEVVTHNAIVNPIEGVSQWSHQALAPQKVEHDGHEHEDDWQDMPAYAPYDLYDDNGRLIAREAHHFDDNNAYEGLGGAGKGYTRVQLDEDARSTTSMDDNTSYLFKANGTNLADEDEEQRDPLAQMQATKDLLTEGQRIAYVGVTRLAISKMVKELEDMEGTKGTKKELRIASESTKMWSQQMMVRLYAHMEIDSSGKSMLHLQ